MGGGSQTGEKAEGVSSSPQPYGEEAQQQLKNWFTIHINRFRHPIFIISELCRIQMNLQSNQHSTNQHENAARGTEVFVGGLPRSISEEKLRKVFSACGEIVELRMMRDKKGNLKGFCFVRFATKESAARAVREISGTVLEGKKIGVLPSSEQDTLYLGNLNKVSCPSIMFHVPQVFPDIESIELPIFKDTPPGQKLRNRGFAFVKFLSHAAAARAHQVGCQPDFRLGNLHPVVQWAEEEREIDPNELAKIKVAFVRNLPLNAEEYYLKQLFEPFGKIEKVVVSKKGSSAVGFVHFFERLDLERAINALSEKTVQGPNGGPLYKLQVEIARPMDKNKKRVHENSETTSVQDHSKHLRPDIHSSLVHRGIESSDPYEEAVIALPLAVKERLLRILRLGIATRFDIDVKSLCSLKELPEPNAISILDQFMFSGAALPNKGEYLDGLISRHLAEKARSNQSLDVFSRVAENTRNESRLFGISHQVSPHTAPYTSHTQLPATTRPNIYAAYSSPRSDYVLPNQTLTRQVNGQHLPDYPLPGGTLIRRADESGPPPGYPLSSRTLTRRVDDRTPLSPSGHHSGPHIFQIPKVDTLEERTLSPYESRPVPTMSYGRVGLRTKEIHPSPPVQTAPGLSVSSYDKRVVGGVGHQESRRQIRFDPYTGEPYKFDPFTGEPIRPVDTEARPF
ncbi:RNA-binding (RRM/RBD/RNP motifs) family protein [Striga hermonthica]|uniref:RNA-binding (RRM/RBD/RNP motifs) family protein n=1 Tax=Striga hermonthica TaxID=68872 RepID=A0A9N7NEC5_STRHE|nr:RNA-binding (RRM/RBD/RNP motifs) family protein [Striga hermonthica]